MLEFRLESVKRVCALSTVIRLKAELQRGWCMDTALQGVYASADSTRILSREYAWIAANSSPDWERALP